MPNVLDKLARLDSLVFEELLHPRKVTAAVEYAIGGALVYGALRVGKGLLEHVRTYGGIYHEVGQVALAVDQASADPYSWGIETETFREAILESKS